LGIARLAYKKKKGKGAERKAMIYSRNPHDPSSKKFYLAAFHPLKS
jgi:hypothetical protein